MTSLRMQPTFIVPVEGDAEQAAGKLRDAIGELAFCDNTMTAGRCIDFKVAESERRFWSPHLSVQMTETETGCEIFGRFSPRPEIWTMFMAIYAVVLIIMFGAAIYGYAQWALGAAPWALVLLPIGTLIIVSLHVASLVGQRLSADQMHLLRDRLDCAIETAFERGSASQPN